MTIIQAIQNVLEAYNRPLSIMEIYQYIIENKLYVFKAKNPLHIVKTTLRRHCYNLDFSSAKRTKYFQLIVDNGSFSIYGLYQPMNYNNSNKELYLNLNAIDIKYFIEVINDINNRIIIDKYKLEKSYDILLKFNIIDKINNNYILTKYSNWFLSLESHFTKQYLISPLDINEKLNLLEKYFLLQRVIKNDFSMIFNLLKSIKDKNIISMEKYSTETLIRVYWLIDFRILIKDKNIVSITRQGQHFLNILLNENVEISKEKVTINNFILNKFVYTFAKINELNIKKTINYKIYIKKYFEICFNLHKDKFYDRVTMSSLINSIIILSLIESKKIIEFVEIKIILINTNYLKDMGYSFSYSVKEQDGYIIKG